MPLTTKPRHRAAGTHAPGGSGFAGEICETGSERTVMLEGNAQFLGSRVFAMPGGLQRILLLLDERDERLAAVVDETGRHFDSGARIIDERHLDVVPARALARGGADGRRFGNRLRLASGPERVMDSSASSWPATSGSSAGLAITVAPGSQAATGATG